MEERRSKQGQSCRKFTNNQIKSFILHIESSCVVSTGSKLLIGSVVSGVLFLLGFVVLPKAFADKPPEVPRIFINTGTINGLPITTQAARHKGHSMWGV